jgi:hypothetical protein
MIFSTKILFMSQFLPRLKSGGIPWLENLEKLMECTPCSDSKTIIEYCFGNWAFGGLALKMPLVVGLIILKPLGVGIIVL